MTWTEHVADHKPYLIAYGGSDSGGSGEIKLEDLAGAGPAQPEQPDWDYNDSVWSFGVLDANFPAAPPQPGEVNVSPPYVEEPKLEVLDPNNAGLTDLKVGKWENAFTATGANSVSLKANFIDQDPDRYKLRLTHFQGKDANQVKFTENNTQDTVKVKLHSLNDSGNEVTLLETDVNSGVFKSQKSLPLVSNRKDDEHEVDSKPDNTLDDRTLEVKLGDSPAELAQPLPRPISGRRGRRRWFPI